MSLVDGVFTMISNAHCPICATADVSKIHEMEFGRRAHLPTKILLMHCQYCNFAFAWPRNANEYTKYYKENKNDLFQRSGQYKNRSQLKIISNFISANIIKTVLDFGCGGGGLLHKLAKKFPDIVFVGYDVNSNFPSDLNNLSFKTELDNECYDFVILSHVIEHIPDVNEIRRLFDLVNDTGLIYVETPNPKEYISVNKPQYCYYLDRLHINHFSHQSVMKIAPVSFQPVSFGTYELPYPLGRTYPAQYAVFRKTPGHESLGNNLIDYIRSESDRWQKVNLQLKDKRFFIYGFGDNFHRSLTKGGPLYCLESNIIAIIDKNAQQYRSHDNTRFKFIEPTDIAEVDGNLIICTVSQFTDMSKFFRKNYPNSEIIFL
jgi:SAM-dependent methyltransferase